MEKETVWNTLTRILLEEDRPSLFFTDYKDSPVLKQWYPQLLRLQSVQQDPVFHPEGNAFIHTMQVIDEAAKLRNNAVFPLILMLAALCHDFGKADTTNIGADGRMHSYHHEKAGVPLTERFLAVITDDAALIHHVTNHVLLHMRPYQLAAQNSSLKASNRLFDESFCPEDLLLLCRADSLGSCASEYTTDLADTWLQSRLQQYRAFTSKPYFTEEDLNSKNIALTDRALQRLHDYEHQLQISCVSREKALPQILAMAERLQQM